MYWIGHHVIKQNFFCYQVQGSAGCFHEDPVLTFPIKIGTYPILLGNMSTIHQRPTIAAVSRENNGNGQPAVEMSASASSSGTSCENSDSIGIHSKGLDYRIEVFFIVQLFFWLQILPRMKKQFLTIQKRIMKRLSVHHIQFFDEHLHMPSNRNLDQCSKTLSNNFFKRTFTKFALKKIEFEFQKPPSPSHARYVFLC